MGACLLQNFFGVQQLNSQKLVVEQNRAISGVDSCLPSIREKANNTKGEVLSSEQRSYTFNNDVFCFV